MQQHNSAGLHTAGNIHHIVHKHWCLPFTGNLLQVAHDKTKYGGLRLAGFSSKDKEVQRRVLLFTHHLLIASRTSNGRLHLAKVCDGFF